MTKTYLSTHQNLWEQRKWTFRLLKVREMQIPICNFSKRFFLDEEEVFVNTPKSTKSKKVNIPDVKGKRVTFFKE